MAEMRLVVAGAGGRMGRTLVKAIADSKDFALAGALEDVRSPLIGLDSGTLPGKVHFAFAAFISVLIPLMFIVILRLSSSG